MSRNYLKAEDGSYLRLADGIDGALLEDSTDPASTRDYLKAEDGSYLRQEGGIDGILLDYGAAQISLARYSGIGLWQGATDSRDELDRFRAFVRPWQARRGVHVAARFGGDTAGDNTAYATTALPRRSAARVPPVPAAGDTANDDTAYRSVAIPRTAARRPLPLTAFGDLGTDNEASATSPAAFRRAPARRPFPVPPAGDRTDTVTVVTDDGDSLMLSPALMVRRSRRQPPYPAIVGDLGTVDDAPSGSPVPRRRIARPLPPSPPGEGRSGGDDGDTFTPRPRARVRRPPPLGPGPGDLAGSDDADSRTLARPRVRPSSPRPPIFRVSDGATVTVDDSVGDRISAIRWRAKPRLFPQSLILAGDPTGSSAAAVLYNLMLTGAGL